MTAIADKQRVALISVAAAVFLTGSKIVIGVLTGSLGILSEALHSGLDLAAAAITLFAVRISDRPADLDHHYGHGKIENISALVETLLLFVTCVWIIYEAVHRLTITHLHITVTAWSFAVVISSILIDAWRSRALMKAARKHNSQALEADALHFSTDIWSSAVVLIGLVGVQLKLYAADAVAALAVAVIVICVSYRLGRRTIDALLDKAPLAQFEIVTAIALEAKIQGRITAFHDLRMRNAGADVFVELTIHVDPTISIAAAHSIAEELKARINAAIPRTTVHIHQEPEGKEEQGES
jgi:cation diffusion facilitator family transporter